MSKVMLFLGAKPGQSDEDFESEYLGAHADALIANQRILKATENILRAPTEEMLEAGWGWGGSEDTGIDAIDEIWVDGVDEDSVLDWYKDDNVVMAYVIDQYDVKTCLDPDLPAKTPSPWIKRMGLIRKAKGMRQQDFVGYWKDIHGPKALKIHIGTARYEQDRFVRVLKESNADWDGLASLYYWNIDAFRYGHFSFPGAQEIIKEDTSNFQDQWLALPYGEEYVLKH